VLPAASAAAAQPSSTLNVWIDGWGSGTVTSNPPGINCTMTSSDGNPWENENWNQSLSGSCHASFPVGTVVTVTSTPAAGSALNNSDCGGQNGNPCRSTIGTGSNPVWVMFCPDDDLCSA
jgi:hypothetical protein